MKLFGRQNDAFDQMPSYRASARDWLATGGHIHRRITLRFLGELSRHRQELAAAAGSQSLPTTWLLPFRKDFRRVIQRGDLYAIRLYFVACPREMEPICVWLFGKCTNRYQLYELTHRIHDPSAQMRRHIARALRRLEAWELLREMAQASPADATIQWIANKASGRRAFVERLKDFTLNVDNSHANEVATPSRMPFWALERNWEQTPPKSLDLIRRVLRRIRHWVRWGVS